MSLYYKFNQDKMLFLRNSVNIFLLFFRKTNDKIFCRVYLLIK